MQIFHLINLLYKKEAQWGTPNPQPNDLKFEIWALLYICHSQKKVRVDLRTFGGEGPP